jgi:hypothetical protein
MRLEAMGEMTKVLASGYLADLQAYDPATRKWTDLSGSASGSWPSARFLHGFAAAGGRIYVFGGISLGGFISLFLKNMVCDVRTDALIYTTCAS